MIYKTTSLELSLLPKEVKDEWSLQVKIDHSHIGELSTYNLPVPENSKNQSISNLIYKQGNENVKLEEKSTSAGKTLEWSGELFNINEPLEYEFRARPTPIPLEIPRQLKSTFVPKEIRKFLDLENLTQEETQSLQLLEQTIIDTNATQLTNLKKIFFYVSEEIRQSPNYKKIPEALQMGSGSAYTKTRIFNYLARRANIPSRIAMGVQLESKEKLRPSKNLYKISFFNEIYLDGTWYPLDLHQRIMGVLPNDFIVLHHDINFFPVPLSSLQALSIYAVPLRTNRFNTGVYSDELKKSDSLFYTFSLYSLPISAQTSMYIVLLLPLGAVLISFFRNIVGFSTFGIFTPVLLTIFFIETHFVFAFTFFCIVVLLGFFQRILLDKLYLLAVPRISILLTFVIIAYLLFVVINNNVISLGGSGPAALSYFPVVIITILIERFSIDFIEDGAKNTFKKLLGTIAIAIACYFVLTFNTLKQLVFTNPELLLWTIALNLLIGNYKGYRLSEFLRFKDLSKKVSP